MRISQVSQEGLKYVFKVVVPADTIKQKVNDSLTEIGRTVKIPGFRPQKAPLSLLRQKYLTQAQQKTVEYFLSSSLKEIRQENKFRQLGSPDIQLDTYEEDSDLSFNITIQTLPTVELRPFSQIQLEELVPVISDTEIEEALQEDLKNHVEYIDQSPDHIAQKGDRAVVRVCPIIKGRVQEKKGKTLTLEIPESDKKPEDKNLDYDLLGKKQGDSFQFQGPDDLVQVVVETIKSPKKFQAVDNELAVSMGFEDLQKLREETQNRILEQYKWAARLRLKRHLLDALDQEYAFDLPHSMVDGEFSQIWSRLQAELQQGRQDGTLSPEDDKPEDELRQEYTAIAQRRVKLGLLISEVATINKIALSKEEVAQAVFREALRHPGAFEKVFSFYRKNSAALENLVAPLLEDKVVDFILQSAQLSKKEVDSKTLKKEVSKVVPGLFGDEEETNTQEPQPSQSLEGTVEPAKKSRTSKKKSQDTDPEKDA